MLTKTASIDQIEIARNGTVSVRIALEIADNGAVVSRQWHRTAIESGEDVAAQMASVNAHLTQMGWPAVDDYSRVTKYVNV